MTHHNRIWAAVAIGLVITVILTPGSVWSWGRIGHRITVKMAEARLTPAAVAAIKDLLDGQSLVEISTWADEQRSPGTAPWHYVNVPITESRYDPKFCPDSGCVVSKVEDFKRVLMDPKATRADKQIALKFLVHFLQDMHCPVHVGDNGDRGGNDLQLQFFDVGTNLHRIWDSQIIERAGLTEDEWVKRLNSIATEEKTAEWSRGTVEDWATETLQAVKLAYHLPASDELLRPGTKLGEEYYQMALPIAETQLAKAGVRVAAVLNEVFR